MLSLVLILHVVCFIVVLIDNLTSGKGTTVENLPFGQHWHICSDVYQCTLTLKNNTEKFDIFIPPNICKVYTSEVFLQGSKRLKQIIIALIIEA